ncbi:serine carboxypeptidase [Abortiporus biennis]|nr:serine carboxypeptidase [Abortiporus biennis]
MNVKLGLSVLSLLSFSFLAKASSQVPLEFRFDQYDASLFSPYEDLSSLSALEYTTLGHPAFPKYQVRLKQSKEFCDGTVNAYTGYIDIEARHLFFYFFESRSNPDQDDVIFWTNGGPGCSSSVGLFMEHGPCLVTGVNVTTFNPYGWNANANIFFIDQPIGVGFSYAEYGEYVSTTEEAAKDISSFIAIFFEHFTKFKGRAFHMAGESYGGRYIPAFAAAVYDQNVHLKQAGMTPINLTSIMIGNGCSDDYTMTPTYYQMQCEPISVPPILDIATCVQMKRMFMLSSQLPRCEKRLQESCIDTFDTIDCDAAMNFCNSAVLDPFWSSGYNPYDISKLCDGSVSDSLCYPITKTISSYLSRPHFQKALGVDTAAQGNFSSCSDKVGIDFATHLDWAFPTPFYIGALLDRGVRVLLYVGANDWICNWLGNERMSFAIEWNGQKDFNSQALREWKVGEDVAGLTRKAGGLSFATIYGAGHMVPYDQPKFALAMVQKWLAEEDF